MAFKKPELKYANNVDEIINAFRPSPLETEEELKIFYRENTMQVRTGYEDSSPIKDIITACKTPADRNAFLLMGHRGCGKSTELNKMAEGLRHDGYMVHTIACMNEMDLQNPTHSDLMILFGEALIKIAEECGSKLTDEIKNKILSFWNSEINYYHDITHDETLILESRATIETPKFLSAFFKLYTLLKGDLKYSHQQRETYRQKVKTRAGEWLGVLNQLAVDITEKLDGKQPIIIFEDLDKLDPGKAWDIFHDYASTITGVSIPIIYTFPVALAYEKKSGAIDGYFIKKNMPIIKLEKKEGGRFEGGINTILEIIGKRVALTLFEDEVLVKLIEKTGGSLRELFYAINTSAQLAIRRNKTTISMDEAAIALSELKMELQRRLSGKDYQNLREMMENKLEVKDDYNILDLLQGNLVLEYQNGKSWYSVHPLVRDFLIENNLGLPQNERAN